MNTATIAATSGQAVRAAGQYCTFWVGGLFFGVAVDEVQEVLRYQEMTVVPRAPESVRGLINLRGQIVTAVDLRLRLGLPARDAERLPMNVIVRNPGEVVSLLVDQIGDVVDTAGKELESAPSNLPEGVASVISGVIPLQDAILLVLDAARALDVTGSLEPLAGSV